MAVEKDNAPTPFQKITSFIFDGLVNLIATFMAAVMEHPKMEDAAVRIMVKGMNDFATQPDLGDKLKVMNENLHDQQTAAARKLGTDAPKLVKEFVGGIIASRKQGKEETATSAIEEQAEEEIEMDPSDTLEGKESNKDA